MSVRVIEANHTLPPRMFLNRMHIFDITFSEIFCKFIEIIFLKIKFKTIAAERNITWETLRKEVSPKLT